MSEKDTPPMTATSPTDMTAQEVIDDILAMTTPITLEGAISDLLQLTESVARAFDVQSNIVEQHLLVEEAKKLAKKYGAHN